MCGGLRSPTKVRRRGGGGRQMCGGFRCFHDSVRFKEEAAHMYRQQYMYIPVRHVLVSVAVAHKNDLLNETS